MFDILESDIVVLQETKIQRKDLRDDMVLVPGWDCYFSLPKFKKGKSHPCLIFDIANPGKDTLVSLFTRVMQPVHQFGPKRASQECFAAQTHR